VPAVRRERAEVCWAVIGVEGANRVGPASFYFEKGELRLRLKRLRTVGPSKDGRPSLTLALLSLSLDTPHPTIALFIPIVPNNTTLLLPKHSLNYPLQNVLTRGAELTAQPHFRQNRAQRRADDDFPAG
jgi:hypothetical protein